MAKSPIEKTKREREKYIRFLERQGFEIDPRTDDLRVLTNVKTLLDLMDIYASPGEPMTKESMIDLVKSCFDNPESTFLNAHIAIEKLTKAVMPGTISYVYQHTKKIKQYYERPNIPDGDL